MTTNETSLRRSPWRRQPCNPQYGSLICYKSIYLSWISTASIVNIGVALYAANWSRFGLSEAAWTVIMIGAAAAFALAVLYRRNDFLYSLVTIWSLIAIALKPFLPGAIAIAAWAGAGLFGAAALQYAISDHVICIDYSGQLCHTEWMNGQGQSFTVAVSALFVERK